MFGPPELMCLLVLENDPFLQVPTVQCGGVRDLRSASELLRRCRDTMQTPADRAQWEVNDGVFWHGRRYTAGTWDLWWTPETYGPAIGWEE